MKCDSCKTEGHYRLRCENSFWVCAGCRSRMYVSSVGISKKVKVGKTWATENQLKELERRVILPYDKPGGGYYVGRVGENGKVQERWPDYRS